jgi:hypothetical protein
VQGTINQYKYLFYYKVLSGITPILATAIMPVKFLAAHRDLVFTVLEVPLWRASFTTWFRVHIAETPAQNHLLNNAARFTSTHVVAASTVNSV